LGQSATTREANDDVKAEIEDIWREMSKLIKSITEVHENCESEKEDLWKAIMFLEKNYLAFKEEITDRVILLNKVCDKKLS
jgi:signal transduction histidine kinase